VNAQVLHRKKGVIVIKPGYGEGMNTICASAGAR
jgi:hypothetical protein